jgi:hypothetical protein
MTRYFEINMEDPRLLINKDTIHMETLINSEIILTEILMEILIIVLMVEVMEEDGAHHPLQLLLDSLGISLAKNK